MRSHYGPASVWRSFHPAVLLCGILLSMTCMAYSAAAAPPSEAPKADQPAARYQSAPAPQTAPATTAHHSEEEQALPLTFERHTDDLDAMVKRGNIRALVVYNKSGFFYVNGRPQGIYYEALQAFEQFVNRKLPHGQHVQVTFIPVRPDKLEAALTEGVGDIIAFGLVETVAREQRVAFSLPIQTGVKQIVVTAKGIGPLASFADLSGKKVFVNPLATYADNLEKINASLRQQGKPPILIEKADPSFTDEDMLEMVNAGILPATVTLNVRATLWASVFSDITPQPKLVVADDEDLAWAMRKDNPQLKQLVDEFVKTHAAGTSFGNTLVRQYLDSNQWIKNPTTAAEFKKFETTVAFFKKYAAEYGFDYLMVVAQGYQESMLEQSARSPGGAVGIMQVKPSTAAAPPISIPDVWSAENNIHAGVKLLNSIATTYFNDPKIDPVNRLLFTFAAYNAGPNRIAELRKKAAAAGLNPNKWFENVELLVDQNVGPVTVQYVSNIYKYYVAYKLVVEQGQSLQ